MYGKVEGGIAVGPSFIPKAEGIAFFESGEEPVCIEGRDIGAAAGRNNLWCLRISEQAVIKLYPFFFPNHGDSVLCLDLSFLPPPQDIALVLILRAAQV